ncbi:hypothetical protein M5E86_22560 [Blautia wexlerae]|nr:hypothetical protein M5E86_22560 [Blautia wexlerae]
MVRRRRLARELMANLLNKKIEDHQNYETDGQTRAEQKGSGKHVVWIALLVLFASTGRSSASGDICRSRSALVVCVFAILLCVVLCLMLIGGKILVRGILAVPFSMSGFAMLTGSGLLAVGAGILGVLLCVYLCKWRRHADCEAGTPDHRQKEREVRTMKRWAKVWLASRSRMLCMWCGFDGHRCCERWK